jgi:chemosensory pili system protein ChpA (sensor histidine kinase/response regulator)
VLVAVPPVAPAPAEDTAAAHEEFEVLLPPAEKADPLASIRDDVDVQVLPIFLDEAAELFPQAGEEVRAWRRTPSDEDAVAKLRRTLHTFKGSARMSGRDAPRSSRAPHGIALSEEGPVHASPQLFESLDEDLDNIAFVLDGLRRGEFNVPLPWVTVTEEAPAEA